MSSWLVLTRCLLRAGQKCGKPSEEHRKQAALPDGFLLFDGEPFFSIHHSLRNPRLFSANNESRRLKNEKYRAKIPPLARQDFRFGQTGWDSPPAGGPGRGENVPPARFLTPLPFESHGGIPQ